MKMVVAILLCIASIAQAQEMIVWRDSATSLRAEGRIGESSHALFTKDMLKGVRSLTIDSVGGHVYAAARIGQLLRDARVEVRVEKRCFSACASWIFLPSRSKALLPGAVLGLHKGNTDFDIVRLLARLTNADLSGSRFLEGEAAAIRLYAEAGINPSIYAAASRQTGWDRTEIVLRVQEGSGVAAEYRFGLNPTEEEQKTLQRIKSLPLLSYRWVGGPPDTFWFPSKSELEAYGVTGIGQYAYPGNRTELGALISAYGVVLMSTSLTPCTSAHASKTRRPGRRS